MCKKLFYLVSFVLIMALATVTRADWVAYNDLSDDLGGTAALGLNVTTHTYLDTDKALMDFGTGATLPVTITMEIVGDGDADGGDVEGIEDKELPLPNKMEATVDLINGKLILQDKETVYAELNKRFN